MKGWAALLLVVAFAFTATHAGTRTFPFKTTKGPEIETEVVSTTLNSELATGAPKISTSLPTEGVPKTVEFGHLYTNPKNILLQEIRSLDEDASTNKVREELAKALKAEAQKSRDSPRSTTVKPRVKLTPIRNSIDDDKVHDNGTTDVKAALKAMKEEESELLFGDDANDDDNDDDEDDDEDEDYDEDDDDDDDDEGDTDEEIMTECPDYCRCSGQYADATTARCSKLIDGQNFGPGIAHLRIEYAGEINLGPEALKTRGLQQLESLTIADTRIASLNRTAFNGTDYLFAVNLTRTALIDFPPDCFQNNTQLSLLTISGQPLGRSWSSPEDYLLDAPNVTELDFSGNAITRLPRAAFSKMSSLAYVNLKNNRLRNIEKSILESMESLVELDLSGNLLTEIPQGAVNEKGLQTLRIAFNNLTSLGIQKTSKLTNIDVSSNRIRLITKDDLSGVPALEKLIISSNGIKRIHQHAFSNLDQLTYLDISDNKLSFLSWHHLRTNSRLQILLMNDNPGLITLPIFTVAGRDDDVQGIEYATYSVYRLECANCGLESLSKGTFDAMPALTKLNLARNRLTKLPAGLLKPLSSLRELDLSDNMMNSLEPKMFAGAHTLSKLSLAGNPLLSLQVTPFLQTPGLSRLDVSRCQLRRIWSEAKTPLKSLRFLSVRGNELQRISLEELKATPKLSGLDASHNPFVCDEELNQAVQWLIGHGVTPTESLRYISNYGHAEDYAEAEGVTQWTDLARLVCDLEDDGPPSRTIKHKPIVDLPTLSLPKDDDSLLNSGPDGIPDIMLDFDQRDDTTSDDPWIERDYEEFPSLRTQNGVDVVSDDNDKFYLGNIGPKEFVIFGITAILTGLIIYFRKALCCKSSEKLRSKGRKGPVLRPPMMLRQGLVDNKNCGLVYKPLQEEIATPHMPKRGSFYSSSTFHYDKIVPESV